MFIGKVKKNWGKNGRRTQEMNPRFVCGGGESMEIKRENQRHIC